VKVIHGLPQAPLRRPLCLAMGVFDGLHVAHQAIICTAVRMADSSGGIPAVLTFDPHPDAVLSPQGAPPLVTTTEEKLELIRSLGVRLVVVARFGSQLARMPAADFTREILARRLRARCLIVGEGWHFGAGGEGTTALLKQMAPSLGFHIAAIPPVTIGGRKVSSTRVRGLLAQGRLEVVRECLGRWYTLSGRVAAGAARGRQLGYPTANLELPPDKLLPPDGIYACWAGVRRLHPAVTSIGVRPTFGAGGAHLVEVHLLRPVRRDLVGRDLRVLFISRIRGQRRFPSAEALVRQIARDCAEAERRLGLQPPTDVLSCARRPGMSPGRGRV